MLRLKVRTLDTALHGKLYTVTLQYLCLQNAGVCEWVPQCTGQEFSSIGVLSSIHMEPTGRFLHRTRR